MALQSGVGARRAEWLRANAKYIAKDLAKRSAPMIARRKEFVEKVAETPPATLNLAQWPTREITLDYFNGVSFPGGQYADRTTVIGAVQRLVQRPSIVISSTPGVTATPSHLGVPAGRKATFGLNVQGIGASPPAFQWRRDGVPIAVGGRFDLVPNGALIIGNVQPADAGVYDCVVNYGCGTTIVGPVALGVVPCPQDYNRQNGVDLLDIFDFLTDWFQGCP
jgi:hypothetical protein